MVASSVLYKCLLVTTLLKFASGRYLVNDFPVNLTCLSRVPFSLVTHSFRCTWLPPFNDSLRNCSLYFRATDEFIYTPTCTSLAEWKLCNNVLQDGPVCKVTGNHCIFEEISMMLHCEDHVRNFISSAFSIFDIVIPNPPSSLHLVATFKGRMNLSWEWPSGWDHSDLHALQINVKYWQEVGGKRLGVNTILIEQPSHDILPWDLSGLEYSYVKTCVQMSAVYSGHSSDWSAVACNRTQMERPVGKPENITARTLDHDEEMGTRDVNVSWTSIPEIQQGGPGLYYEVNIYLLERQAVYNVSECFCVIKGLSATDIYHIQVTACNAVGKSTIHGTYVLDRLEETPTKVSAPSRYGMIIGVILFLAVILIVIVSSLLVLKKKLNSGSDIEWKLNLKVPNKLNLSQGNVFEKEKEVFDKLWEKKESNNNENIESRGGIEGKLFQEEEYQPFIIDKNGWTTHSQCRNLQAASTGYVDAGGKDMSGGKREADVESGYVSDGKVPVDLKSEYVTDGKVPVDLKSEYVTNGKVPVDLKSHYVSSGNMPVDLKSEHVPDGKVPVDLKSEYVTDGKVPVDLKSQYVSNGNMPVDLKSEHVSDGKVAVDLKSEYVTDDNMIGDLKSQYVSDGNMPVGVKSEYVSDGKVAVDVKSEYVPDDKMAVGLKGVGKSSCKFLAGDLEQPYIQL